MTQKTLATDNKQGWAFKQARAAVITLRDARQSLSPRELETLGVLFDKELMSDLRVSLDEARAGQVEPLENILA
ncbi:MAG: hypothetical protein AAB779_02870 [Patescibacteria group bacterium]